MTTQTITAHFNTLRRAVKEARKYGVTHQVDAIRHHMKHNNGVFTHDVTIDRKLSLSRAQGRKRWKMAVDVQGRVIPVQSMPKPLTELVG